MTGRGSAYFRRGSSGEPMSSVDKFVDRLAFGVFGMFAIISAIAIPFLLPKLPTYNGAPFFPAQTWAVTALFEDLLADRYADLAGRKFLDLGSGDGRFVIRAAQAGMVAQGIEITVAHFFTPPMRKAKRLFLTLSWPSHPIASP